MTRRTFNQSWADWQATHPTLALLRQLSGKDDVRDQLTDEHAAYAAEQCAPDDDETVMDYRDRRGN